MKKLNYLYMFLVPATLVLLTGTSPLMAASATQMKACKIAALNQPKLHDLPMAAISVRPGKKPNRVSFTVQWDGASGHGYCRVMPEGEVREVKLKRFHGAGRGEHQESSGDIVEQDGFFRNNSGKWFDPDGNVCHSCTPENGFPAAPGKQSSESEEVDGFYFDRHIGQWRDPDGNVCHTCTPENGFPDH